MTYNKTIWVDQEVKKERTYELINNSDGTTTIQDPPNNILTFGTPVNAQNLNNIENGIENHETRITFLESIGNPIPTLSNILAENEIWLEGAEVSRETYSNLFAIYGTTYGEGNGETTFNLPDFRNRTIWGAEDFGYIQAGLPNITGSINAPRSSVSLYVGGAFQGSSIAGSTMPASSNGAGDWDITFSAANSSPIYGKSTTVQPPAVKVRIKTRFA